MKRVLALILALLCITSSALAGDFIYIANSNPADRLNLRVGPSKDSESLAKYYNGAPLERIGAFNHNGWVQVKVGLGAATLTGYMDKRYLSFNTVADAMPQYTSIQNITGYHQPDQKSTRVTIPGGRLISLMGVANGWLHLMVHTQTSEGSYACFVPENTAGLISLKDGPDVNVYISNPDSKDRLHLRESASENSKSLGKYYNGCVATLRGFSGEGEWIRVSLYGRSGYMKREFVYLEGQGQNPTYYGIPTVQALVDQPRLYQNMNGGNSAGFAPTKEIEVLGIVDDTWLHVRIDDRIGYMKWAETTYQDAGYSAASRGPQGLVVGEFRPVTTPFAADFQYPVYLGPGEKYLRSGTVSTNGWIQVLGQYNGWLMIQYEISKDQYRIGWITGEAPCSKAGIPTARFEMTPQKIMKNCELTDDPLNRQKAIAQLAKGTAVTALANFGNYWYIEVEIDGKLCWAFVHEDAISKG